MKPFGKRASTPAEPRADLLLRMAAVDIEICLKAITENLERADFGYATWNANCAIRDHLERAAILARAKNDYARARDELAAALPFVQTLEDAVTRCNERGFSEEGESFIHLMNFTSATLLLMLQQDWPRVQKLVELAALPVVKEEGLEEESGGVLDVIVCMLVATLGRNSAAFTAAQRRYQTQRSVDRYYEVYFEYDRMMAAIIAGDAKGVADFLARLEIQFVRRATDKQLMNQELLKAAGEDNALVFDVWALALALMARHRGVAVTHSSAVVPMREFFE